MAKARSRTTARKIKDKWKSKNWYNILLPPSFDNIAVADTLSDSPDKLLNRVTEVSLQDLTNDFRKSHIKLFFKIYKIEESNALTHYIGHALTSDYLRRMIRRKRSKIDGVYDVNTRDGALIRVKPFATTDKRIQNSQRKVVRETMKKTISDQAKTSTLAEFVKNIIDGKTGSDIYKNCKKLYPVKRVEIHKTQVLSLPTIEIKEKKATKTEKPEVEKPDKKEKKTTKKGEEKPKPVEEPPIEEEEPSTEEKEPPVEKEEPPKEEKEPPVEKEEPPKEEKEPPVEKEKIPKKLKQKEKLEETKEEEVKDTNLEAEKKEEKHTKKKIAKETEVIKKETEKDKPSKKKKTKKPKK